MRRRLKAALLLLLCLVLIFSFAACKEPEQGKINDVKIDKNRDEEDVIKSDFNALSEEPGYKYNFVDIGRANISIPYPSKWEMLKESDYDISFTAPEDDPFFPGCQIYFHSSLELCVDQSDIHDAMDEYEGVINNYCYNYEGNQLKVVPSSSTDKSQANSKISDPNNRNLISYRDFDASVLSATGRIPNDALYHHVTAFYWKDFSCVLSSLCSMDNNEAMNDLVLYMVSNSKYIEDTAEKTSSITLFEDTNTITIPIMDSFIGSEIAGTNHINHGYNYICPVDSGTAYSHSALTVLEVDGENIEIDETTFVNKYLNTILYNIFGITTKDENIYGYLQPGGTLKMDGQVTDEYIYKFDFASGTNAASVNPGQPWEMLIYPVNNDGVTDIVILTTPEDAIGSTFDVIALISKYGNF